MPSLGVDIHTSVNVHLCRCGRAAAAMNLGRHNYNIANYYFSIIYIYTQVLNFTRIV